MLLEDLKVTRKVTDTDNCVGCEVVEWTNLA
jgi:hypothetical protein